MRSKWSSAAVVCATLAGCVQSASAATITLDPVSRGFIMDDGFANGAGPEPNYFVGSYLSSEYRNFFIFDLTGITDVIVSASLVIDAGAFWSDNTGETYTLFDVSTPLDLLVDRVGGQAIFEDLGSGKSYGSKVFTSALANTRVTIALDGEGFADLQSAAGGRFAMGGAITTFSGPEPGSEFVFGGAGQGEVSRLVLETAPAPTPVPEPTSLMLLGTGLLALASRGRRRKRRIEARACARRVRAC